MQIQVLKSKLHCVTVTDANLKYLGSITIDEDLMDAANMIAGEKVQIVDNNNGERFETYIIKGERGSGCICLNGAAARKVQIGDTIIIISYALMDFEEAKSFKPTIVFPQRGQQALERKHHTYHGTNKKRMWRTHPLFICFDPSRSLFGGLNPNSSPRHWGNLPSSPHRHTLAHQRSSS